VKNIYFTTTAMTIGIFNVTELGLTVYSVCAISSLWIVVKKQEKIPGIIFPFFAIVEGLFIDWRWGKINQYSHDLQLFLGALPSFLMAIGFPFMVFYFHYLLPKSFRLYLAQARLFPFSGSSEIERSQFNSYFKVGLTYSFVTLFFHELTQILNISSRNTFDFFDLAAIIIGSIVSVFIHLLLRLDRSN
jgi:hypothetical protein